MIDRIGITLIAAVGNNSVIGINGRLPWHIPEDLIQFKKDTMNQPIIMGRKTFESIGRVLPGRDTIVVTSDTEYRASGVTKVTDIEDAIYIGRIYADNNGMDNINIVGGASLYAEGMRFATRMLITHVTATGDIEGDTFFPYIDRLEWHIKSELPMLGNDAFEVKRVEYVRKPQ